MVGLPALRDEEVGPRLFRLRELRLRRLFAGVLLAEVGVDSETGHLREVEQGGVDPAGVEPVLLDEAVERAPEEWVFLAAASGLERESAPVQVAVLGAGRDLGREVLGEDLLLVLELELLRGVLGGGALILEGVALVREGAGVGSAVEEEADTAEVHVPGPLVREEADLGLGADRVVAVEAENLC